MSDDAQRNEIAQALYGQERIAAGLPRAALWDVLSMSAKRHYERKADAVLPLVRMAEERARAEAHAAHEPDVSPGDVIAAEPDGTIILDDVDDVTTTWNPERATRFLVERARAEERDRIRVAIEALAQHLVPIGVLIDGEQGETLMVRRSRVLDAVGSGDAECPACLDGKRTMTTAGIPPRRLPCPVCGKPDATNEKETDHA